MKVTTEPGVLAPSERFFSTPSALAQQLFFYVTRSGHYYCNENYDFHHTSEVGQQESHRNFLLAYIRSGALRYELSDVSFTAEQGQAVLIDCRQPHRYYAPGSCELLWIHFTGANSEEFYQKIIAFHNGRHFFTPFPESRTEGAMAEIISQLKRGNSLPEVDYSKLIYHILCGLLFPAVSADTAGGTPISKAVSYIEAHLFERLSVQHLAAVAGLSPSHFSRQFRSRTGFSPHEYIILHRIDEAKALLHGTDLSVKEIAFRTGYHSEVNFITSFTDKTGVSPTAFRKTPI